MNRTLFQATRPRGLVKRIRDFWRVYRKNKPAVAGLVIVVFFGVAAALSTSIAPYGPFDLVGSALQPPSLLGKFPLGTDDLGRDVYSQVIYGTRTSLTIGIVTMLVATLIGVVVGAIAGYYGHFVDDVLMRIAEVFQVIPQLFLALAAVAIVGPTISVIMWVLSITSWPSTARLVRSDFLSIKNRPFVEAARGLGESNTGLVFSEILPNALGPVIVNASFVAAGAIILEAGLSFLGAGDANVMSLGSILQRALPFLGTAWWMSIVPGFLISLAVLGFNLVGDGVNEAFNPRQRER